MLHAYHIFVPNGNDFLKKVDGKNGVDRLKAKFRRTDKTTGKTNRLFQIICCRKVATEKNLRNKEPVCALHMVIWTPMSRKFVADRFKESHPKMLPRTQYKISKTPLNNNQAFAFLYQGDRYDKQGKFDGDPNERINVDERIGYTPKGYIYNNDRVAVDRFTGACVRYSCEAIRRYFAAVGVSAAGARITSDPLTEEEKEQLHARMLPSPSGKNVAVWQFGEYMHLCYWGYRKLAGSEVDLPTKKRGGQCEFANAFVVAPRQGVPLGSAFLRMVKE